jgi:MFS-type transporter involved in bile tolerance (Atg22 family)
MLAVVNAMLAAVLAGAVAIALNLETAVVLGFGVVVFAISIALLIAYQFRADVIPWRKHQPRFPAPEE